jgi:ABC-type nitrate/sulfonate/bicarbonate transport system permease component
MSGELLIGLAIGWFFGIPAGILMEASFHHKMPWNRRSES